MSKYDVVVVGAGPAGLSAARALGENGYRVALLEKKTDPTKMTRSCAQTLVSYTEPYLQNLVLLNERDGRISFSNEGFSVKYDGPHRDMYAWYFYAPSGVPVKIGEASEGRKVGPAARVGIVIDKDVFFKNMLEDVQTVGVEVFPGVKVEKVTKTQNGVLVEGGGKSFEGKYCIAADGVNSRIAHSMGMREGLYYWGNLSTISFYMTGVEPPDPNIIITSTAFLDEGRALFFMAPRPYDGEYNVQFLTTDPRVDLNKAAEHFLNDAFTAPWFKNAKKIRSLSAVCSCYDPIEVPFKDNVVFTGDTGSTQEIENTGAMISGWKAGQAVAKTIREEELGLPVTGIPNYLKWWKEAFVDAYNHEAYMKNWVLGFVLTEPEEMSYLFGLIKDPLEANFNPYSAPKMMGRKMGELGPTIAAERPDLLPKLGKLRTPLKEVYAEATKLSKPVIG
jgi:flavin-dependent dehydrogenase